jgi:hypothetical protein
MSRVIRSALTSICPEDIKSLFFLTIELVTNQLSVLSVTQSSAMSMCYKLLAGTQAVTWSGARSKVTAHVALAMPHILISAAGTTSSVGRQLIPYPTQFVKHVSVPAS